MTSSTAALQAHYMTLLIASGIEIGDTVRVLRKAKDGELGWDSRWNSPHMDDLVGKTHRVHSIDAAGRVELYPSQYNVPWFILQVVSKGVRNTETPPNFYMLSPQAHDSLRSLHAASHFTKGDRVRILYMDPWAYRLGSKTGRDALVGTVQTVSFVCGDSVQVAEGDHRFSFWGVEKVEEGGCATAAPSSAAPQGVATPAQSPTQDLPNFIVDLGEDSLSRPPLSRLIQELAFTGGVRWVAGDAAVIHTESRYLRVRRRPDSIRLGLTYTSNLDSFKTDGEEADRTVLSAVSDLPRIMALLASPYVAPKPPAPVPPQLYGYSAQYSKGDDCVVFGCAKISTGLLRAAGYAASLVWSGNRSIAGVTLSSGRTLDAAQIASVLAYVATVDEAGA